MKFLILLLLFGPLFSTEVALDPERHIAILVKPNFRGELAFAYRVKAAAENLHWKTDIINISDFEQQKKKRYDFVINLVPEFYPFQKKQKNYLALFHPSHHYFHKDGTFKRKYRDYDGYLLTYLPDEHDKNFQGQKRPYISWHPTVQARPYTKVDPAHLFHICCIWGNRYNDPKMHRFLTFLNQERYCRFYGNDAVKARYPESYVASIPFDAESVCEAASQAGITLVLHSNHHNLYGLPSGRIFEAAAASTVIICDNNAFVREHFKDSVLYINTDQDADSIHRQIEDHMRWIRTNKEAALAKAAKAYSIYKNRFLLEDQLLRLSAFHDELAKSSWLKWQEKIEAFFSFLRKKIAALPCLAWIDSATGLVSPFPLSSLANMDHQYSLINSVDFHPQQNAFCVVCTHNNKISFYEIDEEQTPHLVQTLCNPTAKLSEPQHALFSPDGDKIAVINWTNQTLNIYLREEKRLFCKSPAAVTSSPRALQDCKPHGMAFSPCGNYLAIAYGAADYFNRAVALFRSQGTQFECLSYLKNEQLPGTPKGITFSPDGTHLLITFCDINSVGIFNIKNQAIDPQPKQMVQDPCSGLSRPEDLKISTDGRFCAVSNSDKNSVTFYPFDPKANAILHTTPSYTLQNPKARLIFPHGIAFSPDGNYLAVTQFGRVDVSEQGDIIWDSKLKSSEAKVNLYRLNPTATSPSP